jgi:DNA polymerase V
VKRWTGIPVSVGIGPTKTLAKAANHIAKKDPAAAGVWMFRDDQERRDALARLPVGEVWGIGRPWARFLEGVRVPPRLLQEYPLQVPSAGRPARVGVVGPKRATRLSLR